MDIRTKLIFTLVAVSLGSLAVLSAFAYGAARDLLHDAALRQLDALAESRKQDLGNVVRAWEDRARLVASRTQLRLSLRDYARSADPAELERMQRILDDADRSVRSVRRLTLYDAQGRRLATTAAGAVAMASPDRVELPGAVAFEGLQRGEDGGLFAVFVAPLQLEGRRVGAVEVVLGAEELLQITGDYTGLGETGETLVATRGADGAVRVLNPLRHAADAAPDGGFAFLGEPLLRTDAVDYRGEPVWAASRHLPELGWTVVVKLDAAEELEPVRALRARLARLTVSLAAFAIVIGTLLGFAFARPIRNLAEVARRIRCGERDLRAEEGARDEVGMLAKSFNEMTEELVEANRLLERRLEREAPAGDPPSPSSS